MKNNTQLIVLLSLVALIALGTWLGVTVYNKKPISYTSRSLSTNTPFSSNSPQDISSWNQFSTDAQKMYAPGFGGTKFNNNGFSFKYPAGWTVGYNNPRAIVSLYDAKATATLFACTKQYKQSEWTLYCGQAQANTAIDLFDAGNVQYDALNDTERLNYSEYQEVSHDSIDVFKYTANTYPPTVVYHVNFPDKKTGIEFSAYTHGNLITPDENYEPILAQIIQTFEFQKTSSMDYRS